MAVETVSQVERMEQINGTSRPPFCQVNLSSWGPRNRTCNNKPEMKCAACARHLCGSHRYTKCKVGRRSGCVHGVV